MTAAVSGARGGRLLPAVRFLGMDGDAARPPSQRDPGPGRRRTAPQPEPECTCGPDVAAHLSRLTGAPATDCGPGRCVTRLPKAHQHLHFVGSMQHATLLDLAAARGTALPASLASPAGAHLDVPHDRRGFWRFQARYDTARRLVTTTDAMRRLVSEAADADARDGSGWLELQIDPFGYAHVAGDPVAVVDVVLDAAREAQQRTGIGIGVVLAGSRTRHPLDVATAARIAARHAGGGVVGFGLSNDERRSASGDFTKAFSIARAAGLLTVPHAGELLGADAVEHTLDTLRPHRLGHGVRAAEDPATLARLAAEGVVAEVCPASNVALGVYRHEREVPVPALLAAGVRVSLNADDPLLFGTRLAGQYAIARHAWGFDDTTLAAIARMSVDTSAAPADLRDRLLSGIDAWLAGPGAASGGQ